MLMTILEQEDKLCTCCMENHVVKIVQVVEHATYKGVAVKYVATYNFCDESDEIFSDEGMIEANDINKKNAYRKVIGLLTTDEIKAIRAKYDISQTDFSTILGWGLKTITRYEGHAVQDKAHDSILRKLSNDPEWFVELLKNSKDSFDVLTYNRYLKRALHLFGQQKDYYTKRAEQAQLLYAQG